MLARLSRMFNRNQRRTSRNAWKAEQFDLTATVRSEECLWRNGKLRRTVAKRDSRRTDRFGKLYNERKIKVHEGGDPEFIWGGGAPLRNGATDWSGKQTRIHRRTLLLRKGRVHTPYTLPLDPPLGRSTLQLLPASLWSHLPLEAEDNETRVKFSRYPLRSISPSEWNINFTLAPSTRRFWPVLLPQYTPNILLIPSVILKKSLLQRKVKDFLHQTTETCDTREMCQKLKFQIDKHNYSLSITIALS